MVGRRSLRNGTLLVAALAQPACRDAVEPFGSADTAVDTTVALRLTAGTGDERSPAWSHDGSAVIYAGETFPGMPAGRGLLLTIPRHSGAASLILPQLQGAGAGGPRRLAAPALSPDGSRVAFIELARIATAAPLAAAGCPVVEPLLDSAVVRVRAIGSTGPLLADPSTPIDFAGRDPAMAAGDTGPFVLRTLPFQRIFIEDSALVTRLSWAPDGERIVFSDGTRLFTWRPAGGPPVPVAGTDDGVSPAWSPDGEWIAFTRIERTDSTSVTCNVIVGFNTVQHQRTGFSEGRRVLMVIRPDGSAARELAPGEEPAWSPDGTAVFFVADRRIWRVALAGGSPVEVADTEFAREPAVSPDGLRIVVTRSDDGRDLHDLWSIPLAR